MSAADHATAAAEAVRSLNHATLDPQALDAGEIYRAVGEVSLLAGRLDQTFRQLGGAVLDGATAGRLGVDTGAVGDTAAVIVAALETAADAAQALIAAVTAAHNAASHLRNS